jgi:L-glutamine-phosphate cytidylyltransferase
MRVIIPAAGVGSRLRPLTADRPKGIVELAGRPLLCHTLAQLHAAGVRDAVVVTGYRDELLRATLTAASPRPELTFVHNARYASTNSTVSLALTREWWAEPFCLVDCDVAMTTALARRLTAPAGTALVVDSTRRPSIMDMRAEVVDGRLRYLDKALPEERTTGEFFGLSRWLPAESAVLSRMIDELFAAERFDEWYDVAIRQAASIVHIGVIPATAGEWAEIDTAADLAAATRVLQSDPELPLLTGRTPDD